jgi:MmgE/PrpD N-terminal domain
MSDETRAIAEFTVGLKTLSIPAEVKERLRAFVLDSLAAGYIGIHQQSYQRSILATKALGGSGRRPVFGCADTFDLAQALSSMVSRSVASKRTISPVERIPAVACSPPSLLWRARSVPAEKTCCVRWSSGTR